MSSALNPAVTNPQLIEQLRAHLRDVHLPEPIGWWPPAPGWWLVAVLALLGVVVLVYWLMRWWRIRRYRHALVAQLDDYYAHWQSARSTSQFCQNANTLLKRCMAQLMLESRSSGAALRYTPSILAATGETWLSALEARYRALSANTRVALSDYAYQPELRIREQVDVPRLYAELRQWLLHHKLHGVNTPPDRCNELHESNVEARA